MVTAKAVKDLGPDDVIQMPDSSASLKMTDEAHPSRPVSKRPGKRSLVRRAALSVRDGLMGIRLFYFRKLLGMDIHPDVQISLKANLDFTNPRGIHIGEGTYIAFRAVILAHDMSRVLHTDTYVGRNCFVGAHAIIMPGIRVGDGCIVGTGSVVTRDVPSHSIVVGNPAKIIRSNIRTVKWGILEDAYNEALATDLKAQSKAFFE